MLSDLRTDAPSPHSHIMASSTHPHSDRSVSRAIYESGYPQDFIERLDSSIRETIAKNEQGALMLISIDNLAMVMSGYGHEICEDVVQQLRDTLIPLLGNHDHIQRVQRDQFGVILQSVSETELTYLAERIVSQIQYMGCDSQHGALHLLPSIATVAYPSQAANTDETLDRVFIALHDNQRERSIRSYAEVKQNADQNRQEMGLASYLSKALRENRLKLAYQPIISAKDGSISHFEALLRLCGDDGKISSAGALIPIAERMGMIDLIDEAVLEMVVDELRRSPDITLALNVSNLTTRNARWLERFSRYMSDTPEIAPRCIVEITETAAQLDLRHTAYFVAQVQAQGSLVALDDFGSGYTSFRQLKSLSVDIVKIDGAFVKDLVDNADNRFFVKTLLDFTNGFGLKSVAEFVENGEIAKMLIELGVDYLQGYYLGRPENHRRWLKDGEYGKD